MGKVLEERVLLDLFHLLVVEILLRQSLLKLENLIVLVKRVIRLVHLEIGQRYFELTGAL